MAVALCALQQAGFVWGVEETEPPPLPTPSPGEREEALARYYTDTLIRSQVTDELKVHRILWDCVFKFRNEIMVPVQKIKWQKVETQNVESQNVESDKWSKMT